MISKEEIEKAKEDLMFFNEGDYITREMDKSADVLEEYIDQLEQENNKLNKMNDEMAMEIASSDNYETFCKEVYPDNSCEGNGIPCWDCVKQYFEKKVEEK